MKVRMLIGDLEEFDTKSEAPAPNVEIEFVAFPMTRTYNGDDPDHLGKIKIESEEELHEWARQEYYRHEIVDITVPSGAFLEPETREDIRRREIHEALVRISTAYDDPRTGILDTLERARDVIKRCWQDEDVDIDEMDVTHKALGDLISKTRQIPIDN